MPLISTLESYLNWLLAGPYGRENWTVAFDTGVLLGFIALGIMGAYLYFRKDV